MTPEEPCKSLSSLKSISHLLSPAHWIPPQATVFFPQPSASLLSSGHHSVLAEPDFPQKDSMAEHEGATKGDRGAPRPTTPRAYCAWGSLEAPADMYVFVNQFWADPRNSQEEPWINWNQVCPGLGETPAHALQYKHLALPSGGTGMVKYLSASYDEPTISLLSRKQESCFFKSG